LGEILKTVISIINLTFFILFTFIGCGNDTIFNDATIYEDAEDGSVERWKVQMGYPVKNVEIGANGSKRSILLKENWLRDKDENYILDANGYPINEAHYELQMINDHQFILEFDKMKEKNKKEHFCFTVGVKVDTIFGKRLISFNPFYDKEDMSAEIIPVDNNAKELVFPLSMKYVDVTGVWKHLKFDLISYLHQLEPDNNISLVTAFYFEGGDDYLDNIQLSSK
jgi:hypothetical protein